MFLPPPVLHDVERARVRPALRNGGRGGGIGGEGVGGGRGRPGALPALGAAHTKGCRENTEGSGGCGVASPGPPARPCPHSLCDSPPARTRQVPVSRTASLCLAPHPRAPHRVLISRTASPCPGSHPRVPYRIPVSRTASPCPVPHPRSRGPVPVWGGESGVRAQSRRVGTAQFCSAQPSSAHGTAGLSRPQGAAGTGTAGRACPGICRAEPCCGGRQHAVSPDTGRFCAGLFV